MITIWETQPHYRRHLKPIARELQQRRVEFTYVPAWEKPAQDPSGVLVVAAYRDLRRERHWGARVLVEHGVGQSYSNGHHAYSSGRREPYDLLLAPSKYVQDEAARKITLVGNLPCENLKRFAPGRVREGAVFSWHWPCTIAVEAGSAIETFASSLPEQMMLLRASGLHCAALPHPRWETHLDAVMMNCDVDIQAVRHMKLPGGMTNLLLQGTQCLIADNTSMMFEAAWLDVPVVVLNDATWRKDVHHGKRFWEWANVGEQVDDPAQLASAVIRAMDCDPHREERRRVAAEAYATVESPARAAADAILGLL